LGALLVEETNWEVERSIAGGVTDGVFQSLRLVSPVVLLVVGASEVLRGSVTTGSMVAALTLATAALVPVTAMVSSAFQLAMVRGHLDRLNDIFDEESEALTGSMPAEGSAVRLSGVSFTYPGGEDVLRNVDTTIARERHSAGRPKRIRQIDTGDGHRGGLPADIGSGAVR